MIHSSVVETVVELVGIMDSKCYLIPRLRNLPLADVPRYRIPPGSRYDPVGPGEPRLPGGGRSGFGGGAPPNPFGGFGGNDFI